MKKPELLMPAGSPEVFKTVIAYGADAVYLGGENLSLRSMAKNFTVPEIRDAIRYAHERNVKVYLTMNIFAHNADLRSAMKFLLQTMPYQPDALIISDPGVFTIAKSLCPQIPVHISTQANNTNYATYLFWKDQGVKRAVASRELTLSELAEIKSQIGEEMQLEAFVHGAMCVSYSGRCLLSSYLTGREANAGACTHPCRWKYHLVEETRPGEYMPIEEDDRGTYLYNAKDLCMIEHIPDLIDAGIDSLKVEGRMKNALYAATVARAYRTAIDDYAEDAEKYYRKLPWYRQEVGKCTTRPFCTGFYYGAPGGNGQNPEGSNYNHEYVYLGVVECGEDRPYLLQKNKFSVGESIEIMRTDGSNIPAMVRGLWNEAGEPVESAPHAGEKIYLDLGTELTPFDVLRRFDG